MSNEDARVTMKRCGRRKENWNCNWTEWLPLPSPGDWADPILSLGPTLLPMLSCDGHKCGETQILSRPNRSHCFSCTFLYLFPGVFISLIYSPNYDQVEISAASCCLQTHHGVSVESQMEDLRHNAHLYVLCWVVALLWTSVPSSVKWR